MDQSSVREFICLVILSHEENILQISICVIISYIMVLRLIFIPHQIIATEMSFH